jgi:hypothetical protein
LFAQPPQPLAHRPPIAANFTIHASNTIQVIAL